VTELADLRPARRADVHAYFNNDRNGYAVRNGLWLKRRLSLSS